MTEYLTNHGMSLWGLCGLVLLWVVATLFLVFLVKIWLRFIREYGDDKQTVGLFSFTCIVLMCGITPLLLVGLLRFIRMIVEIIGI